MIFYCRPKILVASSESTKVLIPLKRRTKNHLGSMYFGALSVGADFTAGLLVLSSIKKNKSKAKLIFKDFKADFIRRATSDVTFICNDCNEAENAVLQNRKIMGATNPKDAEPNTIRKLYGISIDKNSVHGSDSVENANLEINFFFKN